MSQNFNQIDALLNEAKGNIFEYLVGLSITQLSGIEAVFYLQLSKKQTQCFKDYEFILRKNDLILLKRLLSFSQLTAKSILEEITDDIEKVLLIGKWNNSIISDEFKEADLLIYLRNQEIIPISLKLSKKGSYVNTKSAGVKSFISNYFDKLCSASNYQSELNLEVDRNFFAMGQELYDMIGLDFSGCFDESWTDAGYSELPGQLNVDMKKIVNSNYHKTNKTIYKFISIMSIDRDNFIKALLPLIGLGHPKMYQVICFNIKKNEDYYLDRILINKTSLQIKQLKKFELAPLKDNISSFEIKFDTFRLQIRVKPMNKFTTPSYKINCSVQFGDKNA